LLVACGSTLPTTKLYVDGHKITVEVADSEESRKLGLMHRDHLGADTGMLFVYADSAVRNFWMKDTRIPLSIAFIGRSGEIVRIDDMAPFDTSRVSSLSPVPYALEMNQGWFAAHGIEAGDKVKGLPRAPATESR
jgi:uncharacterized protein